MSAPYVHPILDAFLARLPTRIGDAATPADPQIESAIRRLDQDAARALRLEQQDKATGATQPRLARAEVAQTLVRRASVLLQRAQQLGDPVTEKRILQRVRNPRGEIPQLTASINREMPPVRLATPGAPATSVFTPSTPVPSLSVSTPASPSLSLPSVASPLPANTASVPGLANVPVDSSPVLPSPAAAPPRLPPASPNRMESPMDPVTNVNIFNTPAAGKLVAIAYNDGAAATTPYVTGTIGAAGAAEEETVTFVTTGLSYAKLRLRAHFFAISVAGDWRQQILFRLTAAKGDGDIETLYSSQLALVRHEAIAVAQSGTDQVGRAFGMGVLLVSSLRDLNIIEKTSTITASATVRQLIATGVANNVNYTVVGSALCDVLEDQTADALRNVGM